MRALLYFVVVVVVVVLGTQIIAVYFDAQKEKTAVECRALFLAAVVSARSRSRSRSRCC